MTAHRFLAWLLLLLLLSLWCAGVRAAVAADIPVFGITSGQDPAVLAAAGACMLICDFHQLVHLAEQHCKAAGNAAAVNVSNSKPAGRSEETAAARLDSIVVDSR